MYANTAVLRAGCMTGETEEKCLYCILSKGESEVPRTPQKNPKDYQKQCYSCKGTERGEAKYVAPHTTSKVPTYVLLEEIHHLRLEMSLIRSVRYRKW